MKKALITGITGQDGSYLAEYLISLGYEVHGIVRRVALEIPEQRLHRINHILDKVQLHCASLESFPSLFSVIQEVKPDECYHLAAQSFVSYSFQDEFSTMNINLNGTHYVLSALHTLVPNCRFYFAATSEMFGKVEETPQRETTKFHPRSVYGISKLAGYELTRNYREAYDMYACSGLLFNHESPRRGFEFVTRKITSIAAKIKLGMLDKISLGNIEAKRDWGFAGDYVKAMHAMLNQNSPEDYVIGTGEVHTVQEVLEVAFGELGLDYKDYLVTDKKLYRPAEVDLLMSDSSKAKKELNWQPEVSFQELIIMMVRHDLELFKSEGVSVTKKKAA